MNRLILLCLFACLCGRTASGQSLDSSISDYSNRFPDEKIHVHFDKDNYLPGETVWMRGYLLSGSHPSGLSKNLYFDWTDADGRLLLHSVAPVNDGMASSYYRIPAWVKNGVLHVKVYTQWMLNFDQNFLFDRDIPILMPVSSLPPAPDKQQTRLDFFPEGGDLLNGVSSVLAFEASDQHGKPVEIRGVLKTASGTILDSFHTIYNGLGSVSIKPKKAERITAFWTDESGQTFSTAVPEPKVNGLVLHVDPYHQGQFHYRMERSADASNLTKITVMGTLHHKLVYKNSVFLTNNAGEGIIDASGLPSGVLQLTVLDGNMNPIAERVVFVNNGNNMSRIQLNKEVVNLEKRGRNEISFVLPDTLTAAFSVSVTDAGLGHDSSSNIFTDLLISGDIRGTLPDAASFLKNQATADENLNLLLLTHGWRRFNWEAVVSGKMPELKYPADQEFLSIRGEVRNSMDLDAQDSMALLLVSRDKKKQVIKLPVQANGQFAQNGLFFYDSVQVVYNIFDQNPEDELFPACEEMEVAVIARVPFDEGSLTGTMTKDTTFPEGDFRNVYFAPEKLGPIIDHVQALRPLVPDDSTMPEMTLRFILSHPAVSTIIPGMRKTNHVESNISASDLGPLSDDLIERLRQHRWVRKQAP